MIRRHRISQPRQHPRARNIRNRVQLRRQIHKKRRLLHISTLRLPPIEIPRLPANRIPHLIALKHIAITRLKHIWSKRPCNRIANLILTGPDIAQKHRIAIPIQPYRLRSQIQIHPPRQRISHNQRRRRQIIRLHMRMHATFKIAIATQHRRGNQILLVNSGNHRIGQRPAIANTRRTTITHRMKTQLLQIRRQTRLIEIIRHHARTRRQTRLDMCVNLQPLFNRLLRQQTSGHHHRGITRIGTTRNRRNHHRPVPELAIRPLLSIIIIQPKTTIAHRCAQRAFKRTLHLPQRNAILRPFWTGQTRLHRTQIQFKRIRKPRLRRIICPEQTLLLRVSLNHIHLFRRAPRTRQIVQRLVIHREKPHRRPVLRCHICNRRAIRQPNTRQTRAVKLHKLIYHALLAQHLNHRQRQIRRRRTLGQLPIQLEPDNLGRQHINRLPKHHRLCLNPPHTPAHHTQTIDHRRM